jgi:putative effector of murein hydrolase
MGDVGGKPAINAVAVIENCVIGSHLGIVLGES